MQTRALMNRRTLLLWAGLVWAGLAWAALLGACSATTSPLDGAASVDAPEPCPVDPPVDGASCAGSFRCVWDRCPDDAVHAATCAGGSYSVTETPCGPHSCRDTTCSAEEICVERIGGALFVDCVDNPCGDGPITASCACVACDGSPCTLSGRGVSCNRCSSDICP